jgi:hypothetical protein
MTNENKLSFMEQTRTIAYYIVCTNYCSTSKVQRKFGYYYNAYSRAIDVLERLDIVSPYDIIKNERKILVGSIVELEEKLDFYF